MGPKSKPKLMIHIVGQTFRIHFNRDIKLVKIILNFIHQKSKWQNAKCFPHKNTSRSNYKIAREKFQISKQ